MNTTGIRGLSLCLALRPQIGGSAAKMLYDAAEVVATARCIRHWLDSGDDGMVVSVAHVMAFWDSLPDEGDV